MSEYNIKECVERIALFLARNKQVIMNEREKMTIHGHILPLIVKKDAPKAEETKVEREDVIDQNKAAEDTQKKSVDIGTDSDKPPEAA